MAEKKKQHFVPKSFMKNFADEEKKFSILHVKDGKLYAKIPYKDQCYKNYFYGEDCEWEEKLNIMETQWANVFRNVIEGQKLLDNDKILLKQFAVYQRQRTLAEGNYKKAEKIEVLREIAYMYCANKGITYTDELEKIFLQLAEEEITPAKNLEIALLVESMVKDLGTLIVKYDTQAKLIASDAPVISINAFENHALGYACMGLILFFPISRDTLVVLYDKGVYTHFKNFDEIILQDEQEVFHLNIMQYISAENIIFAYDKKDLLFIDEYVKDERKRNAERPKLATLGPDNGKMLIMNERRIIHTYEFSFARLNHNIRKIPYSCREAVPRKWDKEWQEKLHIKMDSLPQVIRMTNMEEKMGLTSKEFKRGCKNMIIFAEQYWRQN